MSNAPLTNTEDLRVGDVVQIAVRLVDKHTGQPFWWKRFAVVTYIYKNSAKHRLIALTLKMNPDMGKDLRDVDLSEDLTTQVVTKLDPEHHPQGVSAMLMKLVMQGIVKLSDE